MSAYVVSNKQIDTLVSAARKIEHFEYGFNGRGFGVETEKDCNKAGQLLLDMNVRSVKHLYSEETAAALIGDDTEKYVFTPRRVLRPVKVLKLCNNYEYQACEDSEAWEGSLAENFINELKERTIRLLPGYEEAPWSIA